MVLQDLHPNNLGPDGDYQGALKIAGWPFSPGLPTSLRKLTRPRKPRTKKGESSEEFGRRTTDFERRKIEFQRKIEERSRYALKRLGARPRNGKLRFACPAAAQRVRCSNKRRSLRLDTTLPTVHRPPQAPLPTVCDQATITIPMEELPKYQSVLWGSSEWVASFGRRSRVEGWFGNAKRPGQEFLSPGRFQVRGLAKVTLLIALFAIAVNFRLIESWQKKAPHPAVEMFLEDTTTNLLGRSPDDG